MNRLRLLKIATPIIGVAAVGSVGGAIGYYFYKTAPEKWNNSLQEFREVHLGFDGNQMIGYLATGQYEGADQQEKLLTYQDEEYEKTVYVINETTKESKLFELDSEHKEDSIIYTLPGKQGDKFKIAVQSKSLKFRNKEIRENAFKTLPDETSSKKLREALKKADKNWDYDDEDIKDVTKTAAAEFRLDYMDGDVSLGGVDGTVDTPTTSFIKSLDYDDVVNGIENVKKLKAETNIEKSVPIEYLNVYDDKSVTLHASVSALAPGMDFGQFKERTIDYAELITAQKAMAEMVKGTKPEDLTQEQKEALQYAKSDVVMIPRVMADVSPDTQLLDKKINVVVNGKTYHLGKLERYNNELLVSDLNGIYKDKAAKTADVEHYGDLKITSWW